MKKHLISSVLSSTFIMILSSCSGGGGDSAPAAFVRTFNDKAGSCMYRYDEGETAPSTLPAEKIKQSIFEKPFDASLLEAVVSASASELVRFSTLTGVDFFQIANQGKVYGCGFANSLTAPPVEVETEFRESEAEHQKENPNVILEGFYLDVDMVRQLTGRSMRPLIVVKNDTDKSVMIHELMHHIYQLQKPTSGLQMQYKHSQSSRAYKAALEAFAEDKSDANLMNAISKLEVRSGDFITVLKSYPLEEMANETEMHNYYKSGALKFVDKNSRYSGDQYIVSSAKNAKERIADFQKHVSILESFADELEDEVLQAKANAMLVKMKSSLTTLTIQIETIQIQAQTRLASMSRSHNLSGLVDTEKSLAHVGCSHSRGVDDALKEIEKSIPVLIKHK